MTHMMTPVLNIRSADMVALVADLVANLGCVFMLVGRVVMVISPRSAGAPASARVGKLGDARRIGCDEDHRMVDCAGSLVGRPAVWRGLPARGVLSRMTLRSGFLALNLDEQRWNC